jgi:hypothetical protein
MAAVIASPPYNGIMSIHHACSNVDSPEAIAVLDAPTAWQDALGWQVS